MPLCVQSCTTLSKLLVTPIGCKHDIRTLHGFVSTGLPARCLLTSVSHCVCLHAWLQSLLTVCLSLGQSWCCTKEACLPAVPDLCC